MIKQRTADCAWYLLKNMGPWCGMSHHQVVNFLKNSSSETIRGHGWVLQGHLTQATADSLQEALVGKIAEEEQK